MPEYLVAPRRTHATNPFHLFRLQDQSIGKDFDMGVGSIEWRISCAGYGKRSCYHPGARISSATRAGMIGATLVGEENVPMPPNVRTTRGNERLSAMRQMGSRFPSGNRSVLRQPSTTVSRGAVESNPHWG